MNLNTGINEEDENREWLESLEWVIKTHGREGAIRLLRRLQSHAATHGIELPYSANTPYINTISARQQPPYPGNREIERRIKSIIRWNAMAMVVRANRTESGIGGHISTYASAATLYEVAFNHFFQGRESESGGDFIYFQGHASPGIYARAFLEGRITEEHLLNFRRELAPGGGLSSYPHPWLMANFWEFPTVSMGLGPLMAIYQARFNRYMENRGMVAKTGRVWAFLGDGETDEPEALGSISLAGREKLDNLTFVINANLQRLDGPVRGNGKIIQELESYFRGAGWNVIKVIWSSDWDPLLERDIDGLLIQRMEEAVDGEYQKYSVESGSYIRENFFNKYEALAKLVENMSDDELRKLRRGGHDPEKVYTAYRAAVEHKGQPTVIIAKTVKGYGMGESGEGKNITHQQKKLNEEELRAFRSRFGIPISDDDIGDIPFYRPSEDSPEIEYLHERRAALGGYLPGRVVMNQDQLPDIPSTIFSDFHKATDGKPASTTMVVVRLLGHLLKSQDFGKRIVPIIPDEGRTFGMEALFRQVGIYASTGQKYEPVDSHSLLYYKEAKDGQILEEGITESGSFASFIAAGTAYNNLNIPMIPFFLFYSMFGFQRIGDLIWAAADMRTRGFIFGATAGKTTLNGEGLQHQDGHSPLLAYPNPGVIVYDPAFAYEVAVIIENGIERMYKKDESIMIYMTVYNEPYEMPSIPENPDTIDGILRGIYKLKEVTGINTDIIVKLLGSGSLLKIVEKAAEILRSKYGISSEIYSVTSYKNLYVDFIETERHNLIRPEDIKKPFITQILGESDSPVIAVTDYVKTLPLSISRAISAPFHALGTDGFGRSDTREALRDHFEIDERYVVLSALRLLMDSNKIDSEDFTKVVEELQIDLDKNSPYKS